MSKKPMIVLTGPTAVGKTALSIGLAKRINGSIISADSMQIYKHMDIGSAKITKEEMCGVKHYLVDELEPYEEFNIYRFKEMALEALKEIYAEDKIPIIVGGTGFYIQGLLYDIDFSETNADEEYRNEMENYAKENGAHALHELLRKVDPESCELIHENNVKRVIRALEYHHLTGEKISEHNKKEKEKESPYNFAYFVLNDIRENLYSRIDLRVDKMVEAGLLEEVCALKDMGYTPDMVAMQGLGYKEILWHLDNRCTLNEAIETIKQETRHFAKRQLTWFRREKEVIWIDKDKFEYDDNQILDFICSTLEEKRIINC